jgi:hypothetical protein
MPPPAQVASLAATAGAEAVVEGVVLADRVRVLTRDTANSLALWNVLTVCVRLHCVIEKKVEPDHVWAAQGCVEGEYTGVSLEDKLRDLQPVSATPPWFSAHVKLGVRTHLYLLFSFLALFFVLCS